MVFRKTCRVLGMGCSPPTTSPKATCPHQATVLCSSGERPTNLHAHHPDVRRWARHLLSPGRTRSPEEVDTAAGVPSKSAGQNPEQGDPCPCCSHAFRETDSLRRTMQIVECSLLHLRAQGRVSSEPRTLTSFCENLIYPKCTCPNPPPQIPWN